MNQNIKKSIFIIILFLIIICSISMVNAVDISDNNLTVDSNHNSLEINYNSNDNLYVPVENDSAINNKINNLNNNSLKEFSVNNENNSGDEFKPNQNSEINNISDLLNINIINRTNNNGFYEINYQNKTLKVYQYYISNEADLKNVSKIVYNNNKSNENLLLLDFKKGEMIDVTSWSTNLLHPRWKYLIIRGNGATIRERDYKINNAFHFLYLDSGYSCLIDNLTITRFNTAIYNHGKLNIANSVFEYNKLFYQFDQDYGGAIRNYGTLNAINSNFTSNEAQWGGAIYNEKGSFSTFINCFMEANFEYGYGTYANKHTNIHCCDGAQCIVISKEFKNYTFNISSIADLKKVANFIKNNDDNNKSYDCINLNFVTYKSNEMIYSKSDFKNYKFLFDTVNVPILIINGNDVCIKTKDITKSDAFHFLNVSAGSYVIIRNLTLQGFNTPIINHGSLNIDNCLFYNNSVDYNFYKDYGGAIRNYGMLHCANSSFISNYAKKGGAIYNDKGILVLENCSFCSNTAYKHGGAIYNYYAIMLANECNFYSNIAKSKGGAIYNDFSYASLINYDFSDNSASDGIDIHNYESSYDCKVFADYQELKDNVFILAYNQRKSKFNLFITDDRPNEAIRWALRVGEVVLTIAGGLIIEAVTQGAATQFIVGALVGMALAGGEEAIESVCLDHYMDVKGTIYMVLVSGIIDGAATVSGIKIGKLLSGTNTVKNLILGGIDTIGEVITEVIPRLGDEIIAPDDSYFKYNYPLDFEIAPINN